MTPMVLLSVWLAWTHVLELEAKQRREASDLAHNFAIANDRFLDARLKALDLLAGSALTADRQQWPALYSEAQGFVRSFGSHVIFADAQGQMLFNTRLPLGAHLPRLPISKGRSAGPLALETGKPQIGDLVFGPVLQRPLVAIALPVLRDGKAVQLMLSTALLHKYRGVELPLPRRRSYATRTVSGMPRCVKRLSTATRTCTSLT